MDGRMGEWMNGCEWMDGWMNRPGGRKKCSLQFVGHGFRDIGQLWLNGRLDCRSRYHHHHHHHHHHRHHHHHHHHRHHPQLITQYHCFPDFPERVHAIFFDLFTHPLVSPFFHPSIHPSIHLFILPSIHLFILPSIHLFILPLIHSSIHPSTYSFFHPLIHPSKHSITWTVW